MPLYDFRCPNEDCKADIITECFSMNDTEGRDSFLCPLCQGETKRQYNSPNAIIKGTIGDIKLTNNQTVVDVDGQPIRLNFVDHGDRSSDFMEGSVAAQMPGARMDEKTGKPVVDVVSNVPDPLGKIERSKKETVTQVNQVNTKVKTR